jgi:peptidyl-prolyl cis-trans isomerase A (cyclophilin A)
MSESPCVLLNTPDGDLTVEVNVRAAPQTAAHFLEFVQRGYLSNSSIYRIVTAANGQRSPAISVVQFGWLARSIEDLPLPPVPHEPTGHTGLRHLDGSISLARAEPGTGGCAYFFCIGDQPALDQGGGRAEDGLGFAAFGRLVGGRAVLASLFERAQENEMLVTPVRIGGHVLRRADF